MRSPKPPGHRVAATARRPEQLKDLAHRYRDKVLPLQLDVTDDNAVVSAVDTAVAHLGRLEVVVNNAGHADLAAVEDMSVEMFRAQIDTNLLDVVRVTKAALPTLRAQGAGHLIQVSSLGRRIANPGLSAYQAAKFAVGGFSEALAQDVAPLGIKFTVIEPGGMRTDWAGSSMTIPPVSEPYAPMVGAMAALMHGAPDAARAIPRKSLTLSFNCPQWRTRRCGYRLDLMRSATPRLRHAVAPTAMSSGVRSA